MKIPFKMNPSLIQSFINHRMAMRFAIPLTLVLGLIMPFIVRVHSQTADMLVRTPAGSGIFGFGGDGGTATNARFSTPNGVAVDASGNLYIADLFNDRIRKVDLNGVITTYAGRFGGVFSGDGGPATEAGLFDVSGVAADEKGNVYIADMDNFRVRKVDTTGKISTVAGNGNFGFTGDNVPATQTALASPTAVAVDVAGNVFIADLFNYRIRKVNTEGIITTVAGTGTAGYRGDNGPSVQAEIDNPEGIAVDRAGNLYIVDSVNSVVRRVDTAGLISTFAGTGQDGSSGDGGLARQARLSAPRGVTADTAGNVYISDAGNDRIRRVDPNGIITTIAGNGQTGYNGDGILATQAQLFEPVGIAADPYGVIYFADSFNDRIRMLKSTKLQFTGLSQYVLATGGAQSPLNVIGTGLDNSSVLINNAVVTSMLDPATGNLAVTIPGSMSAAPGILSVLVNKQGEQSSVERKLIVASAAQLNPTPAVTVSAASYQQVTAAESIGALFGTRLATQLASAISTPLPTSLAGSTIFVNGLASPLFFVSPNQANYQIPSGLYSGAIATIVTAAADGVISQGQVQVSAEAPGIFTANASGSGGPAAVWTTDGVNFRPVASPDGTPLAIPAGAIVVLFATGIRGTFAPNPADGNGVAESVQFSLGGVPVIPLFAGPQGGLIGLDQINLQVPVSLGGRGRIDVGMTVNKRVANTTQLQIM